MENEIQHLENEANNYLSNYDGGEYVGYTGENDDFLDFDGTTGERNILSAVEGNNFTITLQNTSGSAKEVYLFPSRKNRDMTTPAGLKKGVMREGTFAAINDAGADTSLVATGDTYGTVDFLREFVENNPTFVKAFQISSTTTLGIDQFIISVEEVSPFSQQTARQLKPTMFQDQHMFNDKKLNIPAGFDLNDQCVIKTKIAASSTITITIVCGAILNQAKALRNKRQKAHSSVAGRSNRRRG